MFPLSQISDLRCLNLPALTGLKLWGLTNSDTATTLSIVKARPTLAIAPSVGNFSIKWSSDADTDAVLQSATNLTPPVVWQNVTNGMQVIGDQNVFTIPLTNRSTYFRLQK